jgi:hypothetical protein
MNEEQSLDDSEFGDVDLSGTLSSTHLSSPENLTADKLLDELTLTPSPLQQQSMYMSNNNSGNTYDQFFEEVSLDLPRQQQKQQQEPRLMKFMPKRMSPTNPSPNGSSNNMSPSDIAGPFYSISDVLDDTNSTNVNSSSSSNVMVGRESGDYESIDVNNPTNPRAARRNVNEAEVVATSGGTSIGPTRRRSM